MTTDPFRRFQKTPCKSGSPSKPGIYGCSCCRKISNLNHFKKWLRKQAKVKFRRETQRIIRDAA